MTGYKSVFVDTAPLIYFLDDNERFADQVEAIFEEILSSRAIIETSVITCAEYLVYPYKSDNRDKIQAFYDFTTDCHIRLHPITGEIAEKAARIRAAYPAFKAMDALQLAAAVLLGCDLFLTNDRQLRQFSEIRCLTPDEWSL